MLMLIVFCLSYWVIFSYSACAVAKTKYQFSSAKDLFDLAMHATTATIALGNFYMLFSIGPVIAESHATWIAAFMAIVILIVFFLKVKRNGFDFTSK